MHALSASTLSLWPAFLESLRAFDAAASPMGLYAASELRHPEAPEPPLLVEWELFLRPTLERLGCRPIHFTKQSLSEGAFHFRTGGFVRRLEVLKLSKIKVRKYGNRYLVDPHFDFAERWRKAKVPSRLAGALRSPPSAFLLIGFAAEEHPFAIELASLRAKWQPTALLDWDDPHGRGFRTAAVIWAKKTSR
jgi:hypothetical protein